MNNLIVQGTDVATADLKNLAKLGAATQIQAITSQAFRLVGAADSDELHSYCHAARLDFAFVPATRDWSTFGLVVMDMDSTLISIECIDEIADLRDLKAQVSAITASAMRGEIDFVDSLKQRVALLEGLDEGALQRVYDERLALNPGAENLISALKNKGIKTLLVSGGFTFFTERLKQRLGLDFTAANVLEKKGSALTGKVVGSVIDAQAKANWLERIRAQLGLANTAVIAIGDGANDLKMMRAAGVSVAYHAKPVVQEKATYALNFVGLDGVLNLFA